MKITPSDHIYSKPLVLLLSDFESQLVCTMNHTGIPTLDVIPSPFLFSFTHPPPKTPEPAATKSQDATSSVIDDVVARIRAYHDRESFINEDQDDKAGGKAEEIFASYYEREACQSELEQKLEAELHTLTERRGVLEKAIRILQDNMASVHREYEHAIQSQEKARAQTKLNCLKKLSDLEEYRRNMVERHLSRSVSRRTKLICDILSASILGDFNSNH